MISPPPPNPATSMPHIDIRFATAAQFVWPGLWEYLAKYGRGLKPSLPLIYAAY